MFCNFVASSSDGLSEKSPETMIKGVKNDTIVEWRKESSKSPGMITKGVKNWYHRRMTECIGESPGTLMKGVIKMIPSSNDGMYWNDNEGWKKKNHVVA